MPSDSGLILSARLKALGVDSVIVEKNAQAGDNWALRYDCLRFHIGRHSAETPYLRRWLLSIRADKDFDADPWRRLR